MKHPIALLSTDWHLNENNLLEVKEVVFQKMQKFLELKKENPNMRFLCLGDVFDSRKAQKECVLLAFKEILDTLYLNNITMECIPGNHDKTNYNSFNSYLDAFESHPALQLFKRFTYFYPFLFAPFISEDLWIEGEKKNFDKKDCVLVSHVAVNGSENNDRSKVASHINQELLSPYKLVLLGHYHNMQQVYKNTHHIPSIRQNNFGEDSSKGFTVLYDDYSFELIKSKFIEYETLSLDVEKVDAKIIKEISEEYLKNKDSVNLRVEFVGDSSQIKSKDLSLLKECGIKLKLKTIENNDLQSLQVQDYENDLTVEEIFKEFCKERELDEKKGLTYLKEILAL